MANIFRDGSQVGQCVREWDNLLRTGRWVRSDEILRKVNDEKAIKKAKGEIREALSEQGLCLRERRVGNDRRNIEVAYPEDCSDPLRSMRIMAVIDEAMRNGKAMRLIYAPSYQNPEEHIFHPQYVRPYNCRTYVYGVYENDAENNDMPFVTLPIDRIVSAETTNEVSYKRGNKEDYEKRMRDVMGASPNFRFPDVVDVVLRTHNRKMHQLLLSRPLHQSIRELKPFTKDQFGELTIHVQITQELDNWILYYGTNVEVISPAKYRAHIAHVMHIMNSYYENRSH